MQSGGLGNVVVPTITKTKTAVGTPFITNTAKETYQKQQFEQKSKGMKPTKLPATSVKTLGQNEPTLRLELFEQPAKERPYNIYPPYVEQVNIPGVSKQFVPGMLPYLYAPNAATSYGPNIRLPVQQVYNINLPGPTGGHVEMSKIYENILPGKENAFTSTTLGERLQIYDYVRQILISINDGEDISLDATGHRSLMSYIKFMELNPNYYSPLYHNPYRGLPFGLLIYRSCFPIRMDQQSQSIICAKDSLGLNIRLYSLTIAEYYSFKFRQVIYKKYDVWREVAYYEYVRENIIKKRQSPHFAIMYAFFLSPNKNIDFFSLKRSCLRQKDLLTNEYQRFLMVHGLREPAATLGRPLTYPEIERKTISKLPDEVDVTLQMYSGTTLIVITESPHHNLYQWASRIYEKEGVVNKMISHGFHNEDVWFGILFQIVSALYALQYHGIYIRHMTITDNIYIKDLQTYGKAQGYWKYIINGIPYYIPNYGYVVIIDSNFKDIIPETRTLERAKRAYKIYTHNIIGQKYDLKDIRRKVYENYKNIINTNAFTKEHTTNNVFKPPESIMNLIEKMTADTEEDIAIVIFKYFRPLMNNRIGTYLKKDSEMPHIREIVAPPKAGELAIQVIEEDVYKWCLICKIKLDGVITIITREKPDTNDFIEQDVRVETLKQYSASERIEQFSKPSKVNLSEDELLETYIIQ